MSRLRFRFVDIIYVIAIIMADLFVYGILGLFFMGYDDNYNTSKGPYLSLQSMTNVDKVIYFAINLWYVANIILLIWTVYKIYGWVKFRGLPENVSKTQELYAILRPLHY